jgi:MSHA biogenesis protein MshJ
MASTGAAPTATLAASEARPAPDAAKPATPGSDMLYRHGVEITVRGNYLDLVDYMGALESMPTQLFWGKALLEVEEYPNSRLTLTLYTLSLDQKWMKL